MLFPYLGKRRSRILRSRGRRLYLMGTHPYRINLTFIRKKLERALPHLTGAPLKTLIYEYWASGQSYDGVKVEFKYYP
jgi:hypothetical protein